MKNQERKELTKFRRIIIHPAMTFISELLFIVTSFMISVPTLFSCKLLEKNFDIIVIALWGIALLLTILNFIFSRITSQDYYKLQIADKLSAVTLKAQLNANLYKTREVLQATYGHVHEWHPIDYYDNVLPYDVHEQIRTILIELKNAILSTTESLDNDAVMVDLVYCYPGENCKGTLPADKNTVENWRLISSKDGSSLNYKIHDLLASHESFYSQVYRNGFEFCNDKTKIKRYYIQSGKDQEYGGSGSAVGLSIDVKNDEPEKVLVKAILTISTYGQCLYKKEYKIDEKDYIETFKINVLNGYKALLESELAQMYIRHAIRNKKMCPHTGRMLTEIELQDLQKSNNSKKVECKFKSECGRCVYSDKECVFEESNKENDSAPKRCMYIYDEFKN